MFTYIIAFFTFLTLYKGIRIILNWRKTLKPAKIIPGAEPIYYKRGKTGILFLHGFTSTPHDYKYLSKYLADRNITVYAPLLEGHGTSPEHLATKTDKDWIRSAENAYKKLKKEVKKIYVGGDSFGGSLAIIITSKFKVDGLISMATPVFFKKERFFKVILVFLRLFKDYKKKWYHQKFLGTKLIKERITYDRIPLKCIKHVIRITRTAIKELKNITAPILIMQSTTDWSVGEKSVDYIYKHTRSKKKKIIWVPNAYHVFIIDKGKEKAFEEIYKFIKEN